MKSIDLYNSMTELQHAGQLCVELERRKKEFPELCFFFHVPNEAKRTPATRYILKATGMIAGVPDYFLLVPRRNYKGLMIELKKMGGKATPEQKKFIEFHRAQGYYAEIIEGWREAYRVVMLYVGDFQI